MYNEVVKENFMQSVRNEKTRTFTESLFERIDDAIESSVNKDVALMSRQEVIDGLANIRHLSYSSVRTDLSILKRYVLWYNKNVTPINTEEIKGITARDVDLSSILFNELFKNEMELTASLSFCPANEGYFEIPVLYLSWVGLTLKEILSLRNEDVIFKGEDVLVNSDNKMMRITSMPIVTALKDYKSVKTSVRIHRGKWVVYPDDIGFFIKQMVTVDSKLVGNPLVENNIRKKVEIYNRTLPSGFKKLTVDSVLLSGRLYRLKEEEDRTGEVPIEKFINELKIQISMVNDYMELYKCYKKAFWD